MEKKSSPIKKGKEVKENPDPHIDQDFPGYPQLPSTPKKIKPKTKVEKKVADAEKDRDKKTYGGKKK